MAAGGQATGAEAAHRRRFGLAHRRCLRAAGAEAAATGWVEPREQVALQRRPPAAMGGPRAENGREQCFGIGMQRARRQNSGQLHLHDAAQIRGGNVADDGKVLRDGTGRPGPSCPTAPPAGSAPAPAPKRPAPRQARCRSPAWATRPAPRRHRCTGASVWRIRADGSIAKRKWGGSGWGGVASVPLLTSATSAAWTASGATQTEPIKACRMMQQIVDTNGIRPLHLAVTLPCRLTAPRPTQAVPDRVCWIRYTDGCRALSIGPPRASAAFHLDTGGGSRIPYAQRGDYEPALALGCQSPGLVTLLHGA